MKVSFIDDEPEIYPLQYGGKARTILALARSALDFDVIDEVTVLSRSINDPRDEFTDYDGVKFEKLDDQNMVGRLTEEAEEVDVLSVHTCSFTFPRIPLERRRAALVYHLHDVMLTTADKGSHLDKALAGDWDAVISPSSFATRTFRNFAALTGSPAEVHTINRGVDFELFYNVPKAKALKKLAEWGVQLDEKDGPILFFPGRADVGKGDDRIGQICESLSEDYSNLTVITTFDVDSRQQHPRVKHIGWQESANLKYLYSVADITLSLSRLPESFSQVCIESVACGTPVLAFPFGNLPGLAEALPAVVTCEPSTDAIIRGIRRLLTDPKMGDVLRESRTILETDYNMKTISEVYMRLYLDIAQNHKDKLVVPETFFISPFATLQNGKVYLSGNNELPPKIYDLSENELAVMACCGNAVSIEEIRLTTGLSHETIRSTLGSLAKRKVIIGGRNGGVGSF